MPWEKRFDVDDALQKAMEAFWARGYEATSVQDLLDCMGINRGSLYDTFGDKRALFLQALKRYDNRYRRDWTARLEGQDSARAAIFGAFEAVAGTVLDEGSRDGCLLVNTALELSPHDPEIATFIGEAMRAMELFFRHQIERAQAAGEVPGHVEAVDAARALLGLFIGLRVLSRSRPKAAIFRSIIGQAEALLE